MRSQKLALVLSATVTGLFLLTVGLVLAWPMLNSSHPQKQPLVFNGNQPVFAPFAPVQAPNEEPLAREQLPNVRGAAVPAKDYVLSGPHTQGNLAIFLVHGRDTAPNANIITLQEGLEQNLAIVHETGAGQLRIDNRSNAVLFIQAGDIVKGGTQDRTLPSDILISANTQGTPITALCVEEGRSFPRQGEVSTSFATATQQLPGRELRLAAHERSQAKVWQNVRNLQNNLARNAGGSVQAPLSQTSLQLSLEHQRVQDAVQETVAKLAPAVEGMNDAIGYVVVVNGKIQSADVYASSALFKKLWPKLIRASAVGALAEKRDAAEFAAPTPESVRAFLTEAEGGQAFQGQAGERNRVIRQETGAQMLMDTCDSERGNVVLHRAYLAK